MRLSWEEAARGFYQVGRAGRATIRRVDEEKESRGKKGQVEEIKMTEDKGDRVEIERYENAGWIISVYTRDNDGCDEETRRDK